MIEWIQKDGYQEYTGKDCYISLEPRPHYCDRGRFIVRVSSLSDNLHLDDCDGFPRYYFSEERGKAEMEDWLRARKQI